MCDEDHLGWVRHVASHIPGFEAAMKWILESPAGQRMLWGSRAVSGGDAGLRYWLKTNRQKEKRDA